MRFELWLLGNTKDSQEKYWNLLKNSKWITQAEIPQYSIFEVILVDDPDFANLDLLTGNIQRPLIHESKEIIASLKALM